MIPERRGPEGSGMRPGRFRRKVGLEVPLEGRLMRENRGIAFGPPLWHDFLVLSCLFGGIAYAGLNWFGILPGMFWLAPAVAMAGLWAYLSVERMTVDLRARTYARREGDGPFKKVTRGPLDDLDAIVAMTEQYPIPTLQGRLVIYRLVIYWKNQREPLLVAAREEATLDFAGPLNLRAGKIIHHGIQFAAAMNLPFYDNTHYHSPSPLPPV